ncbi:MAG: peptidylprolyl isomerase [Bacteroidales bacterium]|nr:peptidylprolyl isomerase [Candidatus Colimorpha onthohippi]
MKKIFLLAVVVCLSVAVRSQSNNADPVVFEVGGQKILKSEFMKEFLQSIGQDASAPATACTYEKRKALEDYVQLYVNFRTKLADAYAKGYDTMPSLVEELSMYRKEIAAPYLIDSTTMRQLLQEAYQRNHYAVRASHILIKADQMASPEDTLKAYNKAMEIYQKVLAGEKFTDLARKAIESQMTPEQLSDPRQMPVPGHEGDLGYFTAFDMIYPFENAAYTLQVGEVSKPIRTRFGYHIIKLVDKVPYYGIVQLRHIWISRQDPDAKAHVEEAYSRLQDGLPFDAIAKQFSHDRATVDVGGLMQPLNMQQMPAEYVALVGRGMNVGDYSKPFETEYGWHIIKVEQRDTIPSFEALLPDYKQRLSHDQRNSAPQTIFVEECKAKYGYVDYTHQYGSWRQENGKYVFVPQKKVTAKSQKASSYDEVYVAIDESALRGKWVFDESKITNRFPLFAIGGETFDAVDFCHYIQAHQVRGLRQNMRYYVDDKYVEFVNAKVLEVADRNLDKTNSEFKSILDEYRHGLMIFAYNNDEIWSKAVRDSAGYEDFYQRASQTKSFDNPDDSSYFWNTRARVMVYEVSDAACLPSDKAVKIIEKAQKKQLNSNEVREQLLEKVDRSRCKEEKPVVAQLNLLEEGHQDVLRTSDWKKGIYVYPQESGYKICVVEDVMSPMLKSQDEARGYYVSDFQDEIERQLMERLRKAYNVKINQNVIDEIAY